MNPALHFHRLPSWNHDISPTDPQQRSASILRSYANKADWCFHFGMVNWGEGSLNYGMRNNYRGSSLGFFKISSITLKLMIRWFSPCCPTNTGTMSSSAPASSTSSLNVTSIQPSSGVSVPFMASKLNAFPCSNNNWWIIHQHFSVFSRLI